jgi:hypothetical protein
MIAGLTTALRSGLIALTFVAATNAPARAQEQPCPLRDQKTMLVAQMFFGQSIKNRGPVSPRDWASFLREVVTPRFPGGFTVYDAYGQWLGTDSHRVARERTKVLVIATEDSAIVRQHVEEVSSLYRTRFSQRSVGVITTQACARF